MPLLEKTVPYKTWIKQSFVEALSTVFNDHVDDLLQRTKATIEYPNDKARYPAVIIRFFEREISNVGVGHEEILDVDELSFRFKHYRYEGDIEFAIHALSSLDRDLISDTLIQTFGMGTLTEYTNRFFERIYTGDFSAYPKAEYNYININTDQIQGFGESQVPAPWLPEDTLVYQTSYRLGIMGEFYSLPPEITKSLDLIERIPQYPYLDHIDPLPTGADDPAEWQPPLS